MSKRMRLILPLVTTLLCALFTCVSPVYAIKADVDKTVKVYDFAELLTEKEEESLSKQANKIGEEQEMDLVVLTISDDEGLSSMAYADDFYDYNEFAEDGVLLLINMDEREVWISTAGQAIPIFTDNRIEYILDQVTPCLSEADYTGAVGEFLSCAERYLKAGPQSDVTVSEGEYHPTAPEAPPQTPWEKTLSRVPIYLVVAGAGAAIIVVSMASGHKSRKFSQNASQYLKEDQCTLDLQEDRYLRSTVHKTRIQQETSSSGGGSSSHHSSTHTSSSGHSHGGGGRKF